ncbi:hypothetical protein T492DRAFT_1117082 [Pavlovales sp. CCMP2436]|nr:hypothetical protein T492DRAFT_1117082 [Pavlovales sp. CCMP2436]
MSQSDEDVCILGGKIPSYGEAMKRLQWRNHAIAAAAIHICIQREGEGADGPPLLSPYSLAASGVGKKAPQPAADGERACMGMPRVVYQRARLVDQLSDGRTVASVLATNGVICASVARHVGEGFTIHEALELAQPIVDASAVFTARLVGVKAKDADGPAVDMLATRRRRRRRRGRGLARRTTESRGARLGRPARTGTFSFSACQRTKVASRTRPRVHCVGCSRNSIEREGVATAASRAHAARALPERLARARADCAHAGGQASAAAPHALTAVLKLLGWETRPANTPHRALMSSRLLGEQVGSAAGTRGLMAAGRVGRSDLGAAR